MTCREQALVDSFKELIGAIALQAVEDWQELRCGETEVVFSMGQYLERGEVEDFLLSEDFEIFMEFACPGISIEAVRQKLGVGGEDTKKGLSEAEKETLFLLADNGMNVARTAVAGFCDRKTVYERLRNIKKKTGVDPRDFYGLWNLLQMVKGERNEADGKQDKKRE